MAKLLVYAVYDSKVQSFAQPFFMRTKGEALRGWIEVANDNQTQISRHPADFSLMELAEYDEATGKFTNHVAPQSCGLAADYKKAPDAPAPLLDMMKKQSEQGAI